MLLVQVEDSYAGYDNNVQFLHGVQRVVVPTLSVYVLLGHGIQLHKPYILLFKYKYLWDNVCTDNWTHWYKDHLDKTQDGTR